jgi:EAL domain-containing protein (putative c-di-GMP-specific phosphodiesterase class I)
MHSDARSAFHMELAMRKALEDEEYAVYYQPIVDARTREMVGVEALIRWETKDGNIRSPIEFLPIAEETGLILPLGRWIQERSFSQVRQWHEMGHPELTLSVNVSNRQFRDPNFVATIADMLRRTGFPPEKLNLELTEGILMRDLDQANVTILDIKCLGAKISVDDFGTGYSSLAHLKRFSLDILKIDRSFVSGLTSNRHDVALSRAIIGLAHTLDLGVIAEGVETEEQAVFLEQNGAEMLQGYLFSRPVPADALQQMLSQPESPPVPYGHDPENLSR